MREGDVGERADRHEGDLARRGHDLLDDEVGGSERDGGAREGSGSGHVGEAVGAVHVRRRAAVLRSPSAEPRPLATGTSARPAMPSRMRMALSVHVVDMCVAEHGGEADDVELR
jgi:hypothetical protein